MGVPEVDLLILEEAPLELRGRIIQEGVPLYAADPAERVEYQVRTLSNYLDFLPTLHQHRRRYLPPGRRARPARDRRLGLTRSE
jgi:hypothetical protein